jgi:hypothetical protein
MPTITDDLQLAATDLMIHEFDRWSNPNDPAFSPTTICWYQPDIPAESVE